MKLGKNEKITFYIFLFYSLIEGMLAGVLSLNEFVFIKSLFGTDYKLAILFQFSAIVLFFSIILNGITSRVKSKKKVLFFTALFTRLPLLGIFFFPKDLLNHVNLAFYHNIFLILFLIYYFSSPIILPLINFLLKQNFNDNNFGRLYSIGSSWNKVIMLITAFVYGYFLDLSGDVYRFVLPFCSLMAFVSILLLTKIPLKEDLIREEKKKSLVIDIKDSIRNSFFILKDNKKFLFFEIAFMSYGFCFLSITPITALYFEKVLGLNYTSVAFYKNAYNVIAILMLPFFGKLIGAIDPRKFAAITYSSMMFFVLFLGITEFFPYSFTIFNIEIFYMLIIAYSFHGIFAATMSLQWSIGSTYFCPKEEAANYQAVHLTLTGMRGFIAPILGISIYKIFGFFPTFMVGVGFALGAIGISLYSLKKHR